MPSIVQGFEYDIFISYRHNDNLPSQGFGRQADIARGEFDLSAAAAEARKALSLDSRNARSLRAAAGIFSLVGSFEEGIKLLDQTFAIDPMQPVAFSYLFRVYYYLGQFEDAQDAWKKQVNLSPEFRPSYGLLDKIFLTSVREGPQAVLQEVIAEKDERIKLSGTSIARFSLAQKKESDNALSQLKERYGDKFAYGIAQVHAFRNEKEDAFRWLDRAYLQKDLSLVSLKVDPVFKGMRDDARFGGLLKKMKFPE